MEHTKIRFRLNGFSGSIPCWIPSRRMPPAVWGMPSRARRADWLLLMSWKWEAQADAWWSLFLGSGHRRRPPRHGRLWERCPNLEGLKDCLLAALWIDSLSELRTYCFISCFCPVFISSDPLEATLMRLRVLRIKPDLDLKIHSCLMSFKSSLLNNQISSSLHWWLCSGTVSWPAHAFLRKLPQIPRLFPNQTRCAFLASHPILSEESVISSVPAASLLFLPTTPANPSCPHAASQPSPCLWEGSSPGLTRKQSDLAKKIKLNSDIFSPSAPSWDQGRLKIHRGGPCFPHWWVCPAGSDVTCLRPTNRRLAAFHSNRDSCGVVCLRCQATCRLDVNKPQLHKKHLWGFCLFWRG